MPLEPVLAFAHSSRSTSMLRSVVVALALLTPP